MHILITTQIFPPEIHPTGIMARELAEGLVQRGWNVTVAAGLPHHPTGILPSGYGGRALRQVETQSGYRLIRCWHPTTSDRRILSRAIVMLAQSIAVTVAAGTAGRPDIVLSFGGPPLLGPLLSGFIATGWQAPLVTLIHDIYPDVAVESGSISNETLLRGACWAERAQYRISNRLIVLGEASKRVLVEEKRIAPSRVAVIPVWLDPSEITPGPRQNRWREEHGIAPSQFVVLYSGTAGIVSGAEILTDVARRLDNDVLLLVVGGGQAWQYLRENSNAARGRIRVLPYQPRERLSEVLATSDVSLVTLTKGRGRTSVPSKVQGYMASGRPVLASVDADCDTALLVQRGSFGRVLAPTDPKAIAEAILQIRAATEQRLAWGRNARTVFENEYSRDAQIDRFESLLSEVAISRRSERST